MGKYEEIKNLSPTNFRGLTGIKRDLGKMVIILVDAQTEDTEKQAGKGH